MSARLLKLKQHKNLQIKDDLLAPFMKVLPGALIVANLDLTEVEVAYLSADYSKMSNTPWFGEILEKGRLLQRIREVLEGNDLPENEPLSFEYRPHFQNKEFIFECYLIKEHHRYLVHALDCTRYHHLERILQQQEECMLRMTKLAAVGEMAGEIAHEINNPLTILNGSTSLLKRNYDRHQVNVPLMLEIINDMNSTIERITKIISGIRMVSRQSRSTDIAPISLNCLVKDIKVLCESRLRRASIKLKKQFAIQTQISCDRVQLSQVLINLIGNSIDAIQTSVNSGPKWIEICHYQVQDQDIITITDSADPLAPEIAARLFEPFYTTKEVGKGTGLGLVVTRKIIESHGGSIEHDQASVNTRFIIKLPRPKPYPT